MRGYFAVWSESSLDLTDWTTTQERSCGLPFDLAVVWSDRLPTALHVKMIEDARCFHLLNSWRIKQRVYLLKDSAGSTTNSTSSRLDLWSGHFTCRHGNNQQVLVWFSMRSHRSLVWPTEKQARTGVRSSIRSGHSLVWPTTNRAASNYLLMCVDGMEGDELVRT